MFEYGTVHKESLIWLIGRCKRLLLEIDLVSTFIRVWGQGGEECSGFKPGVYKLRGMESPLEPAA